MGSHMKKLEETCSEQELDELTAEERQELEDMGNPKKVTAHISIRIRGDILKALRAEAEEIADERGTKFGYQTLIQEVLTRHVRERQKPTVSSTPTFSYVVSSQEK